ncbi:ABC transporter permease [Ornithinibacillus salinisoli]|uniref:ABC transporter permease n=1 Tax=Ornithinibacillus salinisoli TaxID=1848459 RepID=A0ABW4VZJ4_9BACI
MSEATSEVKKVKTYKRSGNVKLFLKLLAQSKTGMVGLFILISVTLIAIFADFITPYSPTEPQLSDILVPPSWQEGGTSAYLLGTDNLGRDVFSRLIYGTRVSLIVGVLSVVVAGFIGLIIGVVSAYFGKWVDQILMRIVDAFLSIPSILFIMVILTIFSPSLTVLIIVIGLTTWVNYARIIRGEVLSLKEREFVKASQTIGTSHLTIIRKNLIPNVMSTFIVISTLSVATTIILEASLSFLGLGIQPPDISWGGMLNDGRDYLATHWWMGTFPGIAITITVLGIIFLGDWLRDVLDPRL